MTDDLDPPENSALQPLPGSTPVHPGSSAISLERHGSPSGFVYFVQATSGGPVKIGHARDANRRLAGLQTGCPVRLQIVAKFPGSRADERAAHARLAESRSHGEWFKPSADLAALIVEKCGRLPAKYNPAFHSKPATSIPASLMLISPFCVVCRRSREDVEDRLVCALCLECARHVVHCIELGADLETFNARVQEQQAARTEEQRKAREEYHARITEFFFRKPEEIRQRVTRPPCGSCGKRFAGSAYRHSMNCPARSAALAAGSS